MCILCVGEQFCMLKPEEGVEGILSSLFLCNKGPHWTCSGASGQQVIPMSLPSRALGLHAPAAMHSFLNGCWLFKPRSSCLHRKMVLSNESPPQAKLVNLGCTWFKRWKSRFKNVRYLAKHTNYKILRTPYLSQVTGPYSLSEEWDILSKHIGGSASFRKQT